MYCTDKVFNVCLLTVKQQLERDLPAASLLGSFPFMAPEILIQGSEAGRAYDAKVDR